MDQQWKMYEANWYKLYLSNGRRVSLLYNPDEDITLIGAPHLYRQRKGSIANTLRDYVGAWTFAGIRVTKQILGLFETNTWGHTDLPDFVCELIMFRSQELAYGHEEIDGETQNQWYIRLSVPVAEISGALDEAGHTTAEFQAVVCQPLWDMGLQYTTPPAAYSPTGQMCTAYYFHARGRRVIVENRHYRDV